MTHGEAPAEQIARLIETHGRRKSCKRCQQLEAAGNVLDLDRHRRARIARLLFDLASELIAAPSAEAESGRRRIGER